MYSYANNKKNFRITKNHKPTNLFDYIGKEQNVHNANEGNNDNGFYENLEDDEDNKIEEDK